MAETHLGSESWKRELWKESVVIDGLMGIRKRQGLV